MQQCFSLEPDYWSPVWHFVILLDKICCSTLSIFILRKPDKRTGVGLGWLISLSGWSGDGRSSVWWRARCCKSGSCAMGISADKNNSPFLIPCFTDVVKVFEDAWSKTKAVCPTYYRWTGTEDSSCLQLCCVLHAQAFSVFCIFYWRCVASCNITKDLCLSSEVFLKRRVSCVIFSYSFFRWL